MVGEVIDFCALIYIGRVGFSIHQRLFRGLRVGLRFGRDECGFQQMAGAASMVGL